MAQLSTYNELRQKEVINVIDGRRMGCLLYTSRCV